MFESALTRPLDLQTGTQGTSSDSAPFDHTHSTILYRAILVNRPFPYDSDNYNCYSGFEFLMNKVPTETPINLNDRILKQDCDPSMTFLLTGKNQLMKKTATAKERIMMMLNLK